LNYTRRVWVSLYPNRFGLMVDASKEVAAFFAQLYPIGFMESGHYLEGGVPILAKYKCNHLLYPDDIPTVL